MQSCWKWWGGAASEKCEVHEAQIKMEKIEKMTGTQGGTQTRNLENGLPCSNQVS